MGEWDADSCGNARPTRPSCRFPPVRTHDVRSLVPQGAFCTMLLVPSRTSSSKEVTRCANSRRRCCCCWWGWQVLVLKNGTHTNRRAHASDLKAVLVQLKGGILNRWACILDAVRARGIDATCALHRGRSWCRFAKQQQPLCVSGIRARWTVGVYGQPHRCMGFPWQRMKQLGCTACHTASSQHSWSCSQSSHCCQCPCKAHSQWAVYQCAC